VNKCLDKNPDDRWQSAHDLLTALKWSGTPQGPSLADRGTKSGHRYARLAWGVVAVAALAATAVTIALLRSGNAVSTSVVRFSVPTPATTQWFALSPDGRLLAYTDGTGPLHVRPVDALESRALTGTVGASAPFWSPDSRSIGFFAGHVVKKVAVAGGIVEIVCEQAKVCDGDEGTWSDDGVILFSNVGLYQVNAAGGSPREVLKPSNARTLYRWPQFVPNSRRFLYLQFSYNRSDANAIYVGSLDSRNTAKVIDSDYRAEYAEPGQLLLVKNGNLVAQAIRLDSFAPTGQPIPIVENVQVSTNVNSRGIGVSASRTGALTYRTGTAFITRLEWIRRDGRQIGVVGEGQYIAAELSPDGTKIALETNETTGRGDIWIMDPARGTKHALTRTPEIWEYAPQWSPDGRAITYAATADNAGTPDAVMGGIRQRLSDASRSETVLASDSPGLKILSNWSADGRVILFFSDDGLGMLSLADGRVTKVPQTRPGEMQARLSPDGRWLAYASNESGQVEVYVRPLTGGPRVVVSTAGGHSPYWRHDGRELYYVTLDNAINVVPVMSAQPITLGAPHTLFHLPSAVGGRSPYSTVDGERFLIRTPAPDSSSTITWVLNWPALVKK
jgi:Tol biopolymer transport system component